MKLCKELFYFEYRTFETPWVLIFIPIKNSWLGYYHGSLKTISYSKELKKRTWIAKFAADSPTCASWGMVFLWSELPYFFVFLWWQDGFGYMTWFQVDGLLCFNGKHDKDFFFFFQSVWWVRNTAGNFIFIFIFLMKVDLFALVQILKDKLKNQHLKY